MNVFRVFPWDPGAPAATAGHPTWVPSQQGAGRIDNPDSYPTLYVADSAVAAIAERLGAFADWSDDLLVRLGGSSEGRVLALAHLRLVRARIVDLDDAEVLAHRSLKPSDVATGDRSSTHEWAQRIFQEGRWHGIRWWSRFEARWGALGIWALPRVEVRDIEPLRRDHAAFQEAGSMLGRL